MKKLMILLLLFNTNIRSSYIDVNRNYKDDFGRTITLNQTKIIDFNNDGIKDAIIYNEKEGIYRFYTYTNQLVQIPISLEHSYGASSYVDVNTLINIDSLSIYKKGIQFSIKMFEDYGLTSVDYDQLLTFKISSHTVKSTLTTKITHSNLKTHYSLYKPTESIKNVKDYNKYLDKQILVLGRFYV